ncbi:MAG: transglycosylase domain-containing protein [Bacilli bacterium]|nr:transglycosylase domain-containing protein [Bacilli bacterium]
MKKNTYKKPKKDKVQKEIERIEKSKLELTNVYKYEDSKRTKAKLKNNARIAKYEADQLKLKYKKGGFFQKLLIIFMIFLIICLTIGITFTLYVIINSPKFDTSNLYSKEASVLLDINGNEFARLGTQNRELVTYEELPQVLVDAIVATEDSRYFQHNGVDLARFSKAVVGQLLGHSDAGGGSTLTMQVVKNTYTSTAASGIKGIIRKFTDIYMSVFKVEKTYTKEQIIEFYVNIPYLGSGAYGVEQASQIYFNKSVDELSLVEAATIAGLFQAPDAYDPYYSPKKAESRRNTVLNLMCRHGYITEEARDIAKSIPLESTLNSTSRSVNKYQGFVDTVVSEVIKRTGNDPATTSMTIYTTLNPEKQDVIEDLYAGNGYKWKNDVVQAGIAVVDVEDGSITAVGAGRNKKTQRSYNYATMIDRHPGSTAKPIFDYGPAIEYLNWSTGETLIDDTYTYSGGGSIKNWDNGYDGVMTAKVALAESRNIPALYAFQQLSQDQINEFVTNLGIIPEYENGYIHESHSIGGFNGVNPLQMAAAYATFARGGTYIEPYSFTKIEYSNSGETYTVKPKKKKAMSESTAYMINMMLKYAVTSGSVTTGTKSGTDVASKTGTSTVDSSVKKANKIKGSIVGDSWQITYSPDYVISLWYGYKNYVDDGYYLSQNEGSSQRKAISKYLGSKILESGSKWKKPTSVVTAEIEIGTSPLQLASDATPEDLRSVEYFKKGTAPKAISNRFAKLDDPINLNYTSTPNTVTLTWTGINTPQTLDTNYLTEYFSNNIYKRWQEKYLNKRIEYNNTTLGTVAYAIYMNGSYLGNTTSTNYTYNGKIDSTTEFKVQTIYTNYALCNSDGITITVEPVIEIPIEFNVSINSGNASLTKDEIDNMFNSNTLYKAILNDGTDITSNTTSKKECTETECTIYVTYEGVTKTNKVNIIQ